ncbi:hypothetical protein NQZ68_000742 [Dissostichus eleginoides]|nr:hypothetical protein NQZ68_000742 [Dissostichus eleginoides]
MEVSLSESASLFHLYLSPLIPSPPHRFITSTPHHNQQPTPLREPCQSRAYKRGLDMGL